MRMGYDNGFLHGGKHGRLQALNLGADHAAEHEWGIADIRRKFGMSDDGFGLARRMITKNAARWIENGFTTSEYYGTPYGDLWTAWDESNFAAVSVKANDRLREIFRALESCDAAIWLGGGGVFQNAGLVIGIASRLPKDRVAEWERVDRERHAIKEEVRATGIEELLRAKGKGYFALCPERDSKGKLKFWLNPMHQNANHCGWFTLGELRQWAEGKGPIPK